MSARRGNSIQIPQLSSLLKEFKNSYFHPYNLYWDEFDLLTGGLIYTIQPTGSRHSGSDSCPSTKLWEEEEQMEDSSVSISPSLWCLSSFVLFVSWWGLPCPEFHLQHCRATPAGRQQASYPVGHSGQIWGETINNQSLLVLLRAWTGTRSEDDTSLCCPEVTVWSRPGSQYSPS